MFGFVVADVENLSAEEKKIYGAYYCGLCHALKDNYGNKLRLTLNYDLTFLYLFLSSYFHLNDEAISFKCGLHPFSPKNKIVNGIADYCASMNVLLSSYKLMDDINDDGSVKAKMMLSSLKPALKKAEEKYPQKAEAIKASLNEIFEAEKRDEHNADVPAESFGTVMAELFDINNNDPLLYELGKRLGRVVYIMDAAIDLKGDLKKCRYNPLVETDSANFQQILTILLSECTETYDKMDTENKGIIENVLYSGIWLKYRRMNK